MCFNDSLTSKLYWPHSFQASESNGKPVDMLGSVWEFPRSRLRLQTVLGEGNFGKVWKAEADEICGNDGTILVAVKTVKVSEEILW